MKDHGENHDDNVDKEYDDENEEGNPELEAEFQKLVDKANNEMAKHLKKAHDELHKAIAISEKYGVPFNGGITTLSNPYMPASFFKSKFAKLDHDRVEEIADIWGDFLFDGAGWLHSSIC